jgi:hypothetical protein
MPNEVKDKNAGKKSEENEQSLSPILSTRYAHRAAKMIYSIEKNFVFLLGAVAALFVFGLLDIIQIKGYFYVLPDDINDIIIIIFAIISLAALLLVLWFIMKSRRMLDNWANVFERSSIRAGISIVLANKTKEESILALAETIEELGEPLRNYISSKGNFNEFIDVAVGKEEDRFVFDVLMDADHITQTTGGGKASDNLKNILEEYGAIIIKIVDGKIDTQSIQWFFDSLSHYISISKNNIGLALIMGEAASEEANILAGHYTAANKKIQHMVIVEKKALPSKLI